MNKNYLTRQQQYAVIALSVLLSFVIRGEVFGATIIGTNIVTGGTLSVTGASALTGLATIGNASTTQITSTNSAYFATTGGNVGIGTTSPGSLLSLGGIANFTAATSTFYGTGGINLSGGCFAVSGVCVGSGGGAVSSVSNSDGTLTISPTTGAVVASLALANANTWTGLQTFNAGTNVAAGQAYSYNGANVITALTTLNNYFFGNAGNLTMTGNSNTANGYRSLFSNTTGYNNTANGVSALYSNTTGNSNTANGWSALYFNTTGNSNTANGRGALYYNVSATSTTAIGFEAAKGTSNYSNQGGVYLGYQSGNSAATGSDYNTLLGFQSGYGVTTGARNVLIGNSTILASYNQVTTGSNNIAIGNDVAVANATASNQLNIGNLIYGTGLDGTGSTLSTGKVGIGVTSPTAYLHLKAGTATAGTAPEKFTNGVLLTAPEAGAVELATEFYDTNSAGTRRRRRYTNYTVAPSAITPSASPYTYQNTSGFDATVIITGGTVSDISFSRDNVTYYSIGALSGMVGLSPNDYLKVTYTVAPTMTLVPR